MAKTARHVAADAAADQDDPEQGHGQAGLEMNQQTQASMQQAEEPLAPMGPVPVVEPFQEQENATGGNGQVMPEGQAGKGHE